MKYLSDQVNNDILIIRIRLIIVQVSACGAQKCSI